MARIPTLLLVLVMVLVEGSRLLPKPKLRRRSHIDNISAVLFGASNSSVFQLLSDGLLNYILVLVGALVVGFALVIF